MCKGVFTKPERDSPEPKEGAEEEEWTLCDDCGNLMFGGAEDAK